MRKGRAPLKGVVVISKRVYPVATAKISELTSGTGRPDEEIPYADCYVCARAWIEAEAKAKLKV